MTMRLEKESELNVKKWSDWKCNLIETSGYNPNETEELSAYQKKWTADTLATIKLLRQKYEDDD